MDHKRVEVEVYRIGGPDRLEGLWVPRQYGPAVFSIPMEPGWSHSFTVRPKEDSPMDLTVTLDGMLPGPHEGWRKGSLRLEGINGVRLGDAVPYLLWEEPCGMAVQTPVPAVLMIDGQRVEVGVFLVSLRVPLNNEWRPRPEAVSAEKITAAGS